MPQRGNRESGAIFSDCEKYRYVLWRVWNKDLLTPNPRMVSFVGLNPSTADEHHNDPTVTRCINYAKAWGYDGMYMLNLFAYRATDPREMKAQEYPESEPGIGRSRNYAALRRYGTSPLSELTVACWGVHGHIKETWNKLEEIRGFHDLIVANQLLRGANLHALGLTKDGHPKHPLYLKSNLRPRLWYVKEGLLGNELPFTEAK